MKRKKSELEKVLIRLKRLGLNRSEVEALLLVSRRRAAKEAGWRDSELAMTLADDRRTIAHVDGKAGDAGEAPASPAAPPASAAGENERGRS
jgi:hypothetical protein